jgi:hypothetical protein
VVQQEIVDLAGHLVAVEEELHRAPVLEQSPPPYGIYVGCKLVVGQIDTTYTRHVLQCQCTTKGCPQPVAAQIDLFQLVQAVDVADDIVILRPHVNQIALELVSAQIENAQMFEEGDLVSDCASQVVPGQPQFDDMAVVIGRYSVPLSQGLFGAPVVAVRPALAVGFAVNGPQCRSLGIGVGHRGLHDCYLVLQVALEILEYDGCRALLQFAVGPDRESVLRGR